MKVLKRGKPNYSTWKAKAFCKSSGNAGEGCGSKMQLEYDDLVYWPGVPGDSWGSRDPAVSWRCCVCNAPNDLEQNMWPKSVRDLPRVTADWYKVKQPSKIEGEK